MYFGENVYIANIKGDQKVEKLLLDLTILIVLLYPPQTSPSKASSNCKLGLQRNEFKVVADVA